MAEIRVRLKNGDGDILHPETEWDLVKGVTASNRIWLYNEGPLETIAICFTEYTASSGPVKTVYYMNDRGTWQKGSEANCKIPLVYKENVTPRAVAEEDPQVLKEE